MSIPRRTTPQGTFFVTTVCYNRRRLFQVPATAELFLEILQHHRALGHYQLHAFVLMPDHIHLLLTPHGRTVSQAMQQIKGSFSRHLSSNFPIWQRGFTDHSIQTASEFDLRRAYIHLNPVRAHLVPSPELYPYSSAYRLTPKPSAAVIT